MVNPMPESIPAVCLRFLILGLFLYVSVVNAATISVKTDRDPVLQNESFMILFESEGSLDDDPDFAPLEQDFQILSRQNSTNMSIMNGRISNRTQNSSRWRARMIRPPMNSNRRQSSGCVESLMIREDCCEENSNISISNGPWNRPPVANHGETDA